MIMKEKASIELTLEQANILVKLLDIAVRKEGLAISKHAIFFHDLINKGFEEKKV